VLASRQGDRRRVSVSVARYNLCRRLRLRHVVDVEAIASLGVWLSTSVPGSGSCSLICAGNCWMVYGAQNWFPPSDEKYAPAAFTTSQQISYEPGFSAGVPTGGGARSGADA
jgi:hypothetical protein